MKSQRMASVWNRSASRWRQIGRRRQQVVALVLIVAVVLLAGVGVAMTRISGGSASGTITVRPSTNRDTVMNLRNGAKLIIPAGAVAKNATVTANYRGQPSGRWDDIAPTSSPLELTASAPDAIRGQLTLEFPVSLNKIPAGADPALQFSISTFVAATDTWEPVASTYDASHHLVMAKISHFSWWSPVTWDWVGIGARINQDVGQAFGQRASAPTCTSRPPAWVDVLAGISNDAALAVRSCAQSQGNILDVELVNNRSYGMVLQYGSPVQWGRHEDGSSAADKLRNKLADALIGPNQLYLPPLGHASVGILPTSPTMVARFRIGPSDATLYVDYMSHVADHLIGAIPVMGDCASLLASYAADTSAAGIRDNIVSSGDCLLSSYKAEVASGVLDGASVSELAATLSALKTASTVGAFWDVYSTEWQLADLWVDSVVVGDNGGLGAGFSVLAHSAPTGPLPYTADWSQGMDGWKGTADWHVSGGMLVNDGTNSSDLQSAPSLTGPIDLSQYPDYTLTASIAVNQQGYDPGFGFFIRYTQPNQGYIVGMNDGYNAANQLGDISITRADSFYSPFTNVAYTPGLGFHSYQITLKGSTITVSVDGVTYATVTDSSVASGASIGLWDKDVQLQVQSLTVVAN